MKLCHILPCWVLAIETGWTHPVEVHNQVCKPICFPQPCTETGDVDTLSPRGAVVVDSSWQSCHMAQVKSEAHLPISLSITYVLLFSFYCVFFTAA